MDAPCSPSRHCSVRMSPETLADRWKIDGHLEVQVSITKGLADHANVRKTELQSATAVEDSTDCLRSQRETAQSGSSAPCGISPAPTWLPRRLRWFNQSADGTGLDLDPRSTKFFQALASAEHLGDDRGDTH
jgi:hypothetical protein